MTNDGSDLAAEVVRLLEAEGMRAVVLNLPAVSEPVNTQNFITLEAASDEAIGRAVETIRQRYGKVGAFIHLHPHLEFQGRNFAQHFQRDQAIVKTVFLLAKYLQPDLVELGRQQRAAFLTVSRLDGKLGLGRRGNVSVVGGGLPGLVKSLNLEWPAVFCRAVDLEPELPADDNAAQVIAELHDADLATLETGFSRDGRCTIAAKPVAVPEHQEIATTVTPDSVFLVSGGARGVTATCVVEMAKAFGCKFILLGRSPAEGDLPDFARGDLDEATLKRRIMEDLKARGEAPSLPKVKQVFNRLTGLKEIKDTLDQIEANGGRAVYVQADVTDLAGVQAGLAAATQQLGPVTGIIHGAGRLADKYIQDKAEADFENVLSVKLDGLLTLLRSVDLNRLDHLVLFSSVAGFYGNVGQTDYAIANEILSKAAHLFKTNHPDTHVAAVNWGAWDAGMVSPELKKKLEAAGVTLVNSAGGAAMMVNELNSAYAGQPQVIIGGTLPAAVSYLDGPLHTHRVRRRLTLEANPFLNHHVIQGKAVLPVVNAVGWMAQSCERLYPDFRVFRVEDTRLFKGIVFDGSQAEAYVLELKETEKSTDKIVFETTVLSEGDNLPTYHYKATVTLVPQRAKVEAPGFQARLSGSYASTDGATLYRDGSLFHDTYFRGIEKILDWTEEQIVLRCRAPQVPPADQGQFPVRSVNTFFADIQYQGMVIWVQRYKDGAKSLPLQTDSATLYRPIPFDKELLVHVRVVESSDFRMVADCTVYDEAGTVYMITKGAAVTVSKQLEW